MKRKLILSIIYILIFVIFCTVLILLGRAALYHFYPLKFDETIKKYSEEYNLDVNLVRAVIYTESKYNKDALSNKGAIGLMQVTADTKDWICEKYDIPIPHTNELYEPDTNIMIGCLILKSHFDEFESTETVLAAYNAGRGVVNDWLDNRLYSSDGVALNNIPYSETSKYVSKVIKLIETYKILYEKE